MYVLTSLVGISKIRASVLHPVQLSKGGGVKEGEMRQETLIGGKTPFWVVTTNTLGE